MLNRLTRSNSSAIITTALSRRLTNTELESINNDRYLFHHFVNIDDHLLTTRTLRSNNKKAIFSWNGGLNLLESITYLLYFIPGSGFLSILGGHFVHALKDSYYKLGLEEKANTNTKTKTLNVVLNVVEWIALLATAASPLFVLGSLGVAIFNGFCNIGQKYLAYKKALANTKPFCHQDDNNPVLQQFNQAVYMKNLSYAKSELYITARNEIVRVVGILFLASVFVGSLTFLTGGFLPLICIGIGAAFTAYNLYARRKLENKTLGREVQINTKLHEISVARFSAGQEARDRQALITASIHPITTTEARIRAEQRIHAIRAELDRRAQEDHATAEIIKAHPELKEAALKSNNAELYNVYELLQQMVSDYITAQDIQKSGGGRVKLAQAEVLLPDDWRHWRQQEEKRIRDTSEKWKPQEEESEVVVVASSSPAPRIAVQQPQEVQSQQFATTSTKPLSPLAQIYAIPKLDKAYKALKAYDKKKLETLKEYSDLLEDHKLSDPLLCNIKNNLQKLKCPVSMEFPWEIEDKTRHVLLGHVSFSYVYLRNTFSNSKGVQVLAPYGLTLTDNGDIVSSADSTNTPIVIQSQNQLIDETIELIEKSKEQQAEKEKEAREADKQKRADVLGKKVRMGSK